jgi:tetratricopeptide (TPR) repeat protein
MDEDIIKNIFYTAQQAHKTSDFARAELLYKKILEINSAHPETLHFMGLLCGQQEKFPEAVFYLHQASEITPGNPALYNNLAEAYRKNGQNGEAIKYFIEAIKTDPEFAEPYFNLGLLFSKKGNFEKAAGYFQRVIKLKPADFIAYKNLGNVFLFQKKYQNAYYSFISSLKINPNQPDLYNLIGEIEKVQNGLPAAGKTNNSDKLAKAALDKFLKKSELRAGLPDKLIIHEFIEEKGSFADFINSAISLYKLCRQRKIAYFINFGKNPLAELFFYPKQPPAADEIHNFPAVELYRDDLDGYYPEVLNSFFNFLNYEKFQFVLRTNHYFFEAFQEPFFIGDLFKPTEQVLLRKNNLLEQYQLQPGEYISLFLEISENDVFINKLKGHIEKIKFLAPGKRILLFSKNYFPEEIRQLSGITFFNNFPGSAEIEKYLNTVCEFLITGDSDSVYFFSEPGSEFYGESYQFARLAASLNGKICNPLD